MKKFSLGLSVAFCIFAIFSIYLKEIYQKKFDFLSQESRKCVMSLSEQLTNTTSEKDEIEKKLCNALLDKQELLDNQRKIIYQNNDLMEDNIKSLNEKIFLATKLKGSFNENIELQSRLINNLQTALNLKRELEFAKIIPYPNMETDLKHQNYILQDWLNCIDSIDIENDTIVMLKKISKNLLAIDVEALEERFLRDSIENKDSLAIFFSFFSKPDDTPFNQTKAFYSQAMNTIVVYSLTEYTDNPWKISKTLMHELTHALYRDKDHVLTPEIEKMIFYHLYDKGVFNK